MVSVFKTVYFGCFKYDLYSRVLFGYIFRKVLFMSVVQKIVKEIS